MRLLYVGESWQGSNARSVREALSGLPGVVIQEVDEDHFLPRHNGVPLRLANRLLRPLQRQDLASVFRKTFTVFQPDAVVVYKGAGIGAGLVEEVRAARVPAINIFPDYSPHAYGASLEAAIGRYDLVISTKPFHPPLWRSVYEYENDCVCVPHGYDPMVHLWDQPAPGDQYDVAMCANWRPEYHQLVMDFARELAPDRVSVAIGGRGWSERRRDFPAQWRFVGDQSGWSYGGFLRSAKIVIAPVNREVLVNGVRQPGDEDTARTYELGAAHCFFLHQRTDYVQTIYDELSEVPMWRDASELVAHVRRWLPDQDARLAMAARAHARSVPEYAVSSRAKRALEYIESLVQKRKLNG